MKKERKNFNVSIIVSLALLTIVIFSFTTCDDGSKPCSHAWDEWVTTINPAIRTHGEQTRICYKCGKQEKQPVVPLHCECEGKSYCSCGDNCSCGNTCECTESEKQHTHNPDRQEATCMFAVKCTVCAYIIESSASHTPNIPEPTCTAAQRCIVCEGILQSAIAHIPNRQEATCTQAKSCIVCQIIIHAALGHAGLGAIEPSCTQEGYDGSGNCVRCSLPVTGTVIPAFGHSPDRLDATCTQAKACTTCNITLQNIIAHTPNIPSATCTDNQNCMVCGSLLHAAAGHSYSVWSMTTAATCTAAAIEKRTCHCGNEETQYSSVNPALGHTGLNAAIAATCTTAGNSQAHGNCTRSGCEQIVAGTVLPVLGHNYVWTTSKAAAYCTSATDHGNGEEELRCERYNVCSGAKETRATPCLGTQGLFSSNSSVTAAIGSIKGNTSVTSVCIPDYNSNTLVTSISGNGYSNSTITSVRIGANVTSISFHAFSGCKSLTSITIPDSVASISRFAFNGCTSLTSITVGANNPYYSSQSGILYNKNKTSIIAWPAASGSITIPNSVTSIGDGAFIGCESLTSITIPDSVTSIDNYAFYNCTSLTSITIAANSQLDIIGERAFQYCTSLTSITIPNSVISIGEYAFSGCAGLTSITIGNSVTSIGYSAFADCSALTSIIIPDSVTSIDAWAFDGCTSLTSVTFQGTITSVNLHNNTFGTNFNIGYIGDLRDKYLAGGIGTYTCPIGSNTWTKQ